MKRQKKILAIHSETLRHLAGDELALVRAAVQQAPESQVKLPPPPPPPPPTKAPDPPQARQCG